jgi:hypothetical protein
MENHGKSPSLNRYIKHKTSINGAFSMAMEQITRG